MRVWVTGASGLVGGRVLRRLVERGHRALAFSRRRIDGPAPTFEADLLGPGWEETALAALEPEAIIHCAALADVDAAERDPELAWASNAELPARIARLARARGAHLVHVSTDYVFDGEAGPYAEDDRPNPIGAYGRSKLGGELAVRTLAGPHAIARTAVVFGAPATTRANFGTTLIDSLRAGRPVRVFEDQLVSPSLAASVAEMLVELCERRLTGTWHACGAEAVTRLEFAEAVCQRFGLDRALLRPMRLASAGLAGPRPLRAGLRADRARTSLEARPLSLAEALERFAAELGDRFDQGTR